MPRRRRSPSSPKYRARVGYEGEYYLVRKFVSKGKKGSYAVRTPGSGSGKMAKPDIIAVDDGELLAIETKTSRKDYVMLNKNQAERLTSFCESFAVRCPFCGRSFSPKAVLAARFLNRGWKFVEVPLDLHDKLILRLEDSKTKKR